MLLISDISDRNISNNSNWGLSGRDAIRRFDYLHPPVGSIQKRDKCVSRHMKNTPKIFFLIKTTVLNIIAAVDGHNKMGKVCLNGIKLIHCQMIMIIHCHEGLKLLTMRWKFPVLLFCPIPKSYQ